MDTPHSRTMILFGRIAAITLVTAALAACQSPAPKEAVAAASPPMVSAAGIAPPPLARKVDHNDELHGVVLADPYRWLESADDEQAKAWVARQDNYAKQVMARAPGQAALLQSLADEVRQLPTLGTVAPTTDKIVIGRWLESGLAYHAVDGASGVERPLFDGQALKSAGRSAQLRIATPSWDGRYVAVTATDRGDSAPQVSVFDVANGKLLADFIPDLLTTTSGSRYRVTWLPDSSGFIYPRLAAGAVSGPAVDQLARGRQFLHRIGTAQTDDLPVFGHGVVPAITMAADDLPASIVTAPGSPWILATLARVKEDRAELWAARLDDVLAGNARWQQIGDDDSAQPLLRGDAVYAISAKGADRRQIVRRDLGTDQREWTTAVAERSGVIRSFVLSADAIHFSELAHGVMQLRRARYDGDAVTTVPVPIAGGLRFAAQNPQVPGAWIEAQSWIDPGDWFRVSPDSDVAVVARITPGGKPHAHDDLVIREILLRAEDGVDVPVSLIHRRDLKRDGTTPLLLEAYGGYGNVQVSAYNPGHLVWVRQGAIYAYAHVRGNGELGEAWHRAALREHKGRSTADAIAVAEQLIAQGYTRAGRIALLGTSSGAQIPGLALAQRPEPFGVAIFNVGQPDEIRGAQIDPTAARNLAEMGDLDSAAGVELLRLASPYHRVPVAVNLPAVLVKSAMDDYNFGGVMSAGKYVARLQAANTGTRPVVWMNLPGGHSDLFGDDFDAGAQAMAFMLWQTGHPRFQPKARVP